MERRHSHLDTPQDAGEQRTETYKRYDEGAAETATQRGAKSVSGVSGSAGKQAGTVRMSLCILGRQPALGLAELESLYGADKVQPIGSQAALLKMSPPEVDFSRLGGTVKFCKVLTVLDTVNWEKIQKFLEESVPQHLGNLPEGKMKLGLSVYDIDINAPRLNATALGLKKIIKAAERSVRVVPNTEKTLNSAQVLHNQLTGALGWELVFVRDGSKTVVAQNIAEQDIEAYAARDQARPKRDARVGMLPPKLAQTIVNLASGVAETVGRTCGPHDPKGKAVLDPFCGTGVVLQEALLMGYDAYGTDLEERMVDYSKANMDWLASRYKLDGLTYLLETGDATDFEWQAFDMVAAETYLGRPFSAEPKPEVLQEVIRDVDTIHKKFLQNIAKQTKQGFRMCIAVPAWKTKSGFKHLPTLDRLTDMGYTRTSFAHVSNNDLVYHRPDQIVARELVVLTRK